MVANLAHSVVIKPPPSIKAPVTSLIPEEAFTSGLLDKDHHDSLLKDITRIVRKAGVPVHTVWSRLSSVCSEEEVAWVRGFNSSSEAGLAFVGNQERNNVSEKMYAITGALLRNYMDARVLSVQDVIRKTKDDTMPVPTLLLIPNFCVEKEAGGSIPEWEISFLLGLLIERAGAGLKTIIQFPSKAVLEKQYGEVFVDHILSNYVLSKGSKLSYPLPKEKASTPIQ